MGHGASIAAESAPSAPTADLSPDGDPVQAALPAGPHQQAAQRTGR